MCLKVDGTALTTYEKKSNCYTKHNGPAQPSKALMQNVQETPAVLSTQDNCQSDHHYQSHIIYWYGHHACKRCYIMHLVQTNKKSSQQRSQQKRCKISYTCCLTAQSKLCVSSMAGMLTAYSVIVEDKTTWSYGQAG